MSQSPTAAVGQVAADGQFRWDGQQWVPIPQSEREPTPWTRPMQLAAAALLTAEAVVSVGAFVIFYNHDAVKRSLESAGTAVPQGMTEDQLITFTIVLAVGVAVFFAVLELFGALGAFLRWRWSFWYVIVLMALGGVSAILGLRSVVQPSSSAIPFGVAVLEELLAVAAIPMLVWMLIAAVRYGPWAMKRPGT